jgi:hypothetical protein
MTVWPEYVRLSGRIHKDKPLTMFNQTPPSDAIKDGKMVDVVGKLGILAYKNKYEVNFEYTFFSSRYL